jgi:RNA polymerase sigma factor (sigma-70 family)
MATIDELWAEYHRTRSVEDRNRLVEQHIGLAHACAAREWRRLPKHITYDEVLSAAYEGLISAVSSHEPRRGAFSTIAYLCMKSRIRGWLRGLQPAGFRKKYMPVDLLPCEFNNSDLAEAKQAPRTERPDCVCDETCRRDFLLDGLRPLERDVCLSVYYEGGTRQDSARRSGVCRQWAELSHHTAIEHLRERFRGQTYREIAEMVT